MIDLDLSGTSDLSSLKETLVTMRHQVEALRHAVYENVQRQRQSLDEYERAEWDRFCRLVEPLERQIEYLTRALAQTELRLPTIAQ
jgi:hypothetical protein